MEHAGRAVTLRLAAVSRLPRQRGQALVFATITLAVVLLAMLVMVSSGQLATEKMRLQNTADAGAYSGALALARDYNFSAYTNRAMVANQVAIAQWVGMTSWARHNEHAFTGLAGVLAPCIAAMVGQPSFKAVELCVDEWPAYGRKASSFKSRVENLAGPSITGLNGLMESLSEAQKIYHAGTTVAVPLTVRDVIAANDPQASLAVSAANTLFTAQFINRRMAFSRTYDSAEDLKRFADVTHRSLDVFSGSNDIVQRLGPIPFPVAFSEGGLRNVPIPWIGGGTMLLTGLHSGGTELSADFKSWRAIDVSSMSGYAQWFRGCSHWYTLGLPTCWQYDPIYFPLGWNGAYAGSSGPSLDKLMDGNYLRGMTSYGNAMLSNAVPATTQLALGANSVGSYRGLQPYQELKNIARDPANGMKNVDATVSGSDIPSVVIEVEKAASAIRTTANMDGGPNGEAPVGAGKLALRLPDRQARQKMRVVAGAEVYFARPRARDDGAIEWPSLFNPYWQARLRDTRIEAAETRLETAVSGGK